MKKITDLSPKKVFGYFEEISKIPRGSGNTDKIAMYCLNFAKEHNLKAVKDQGGNVIIYADGTSGYENSEPLILQGHLDMVCDTDDNCKIDMSAEGVELCTDGEYIWANGTTLGGDNGIAIAYVLAILDSDNIPHPPIEVLFTNDEEIGLIGATKLDQTLLKGKRLINLDYEKEGVLTVSCAGGVRAYCELPLNFIASDKKFSAYEVEISGLIGGHSGIDINKHRKNATVVLGRLLQYVSHFSDIYVADVVGGGKTNAIPHNAKAIVCIDKNEYSKFDDAVNQFRKICFKEYATIEPNLSITVKEVKLPEKHTDAKSTSTLIFTLLQIPNGVQAMSPDIPDMVQTSLNLGDLKIEGNVMKMGFLIRSNASTGKQLTVQKLHSFISYLDGRIEFASDYPVWEYKPQSPLRDIMVEVFEEFYADTPEITAIHAGLECGVLSGKIPDADMVSFGPDIENVHTAKERMSVASVERCYNYLLKVIEKCK